MTGIKPDSAFCFSHARPRRVPPAGLERVHGTECLHVKARIEAAADEPYAKTRLRPFVLFMSHGSQ
jgi:hypothetical protein